MQINLHIYTDIDNPKWEDIRCNNCGGTICQAQADIINVTLNTSLAPYIYKTGTSFTKVMCRRCRTVTNLLVTPYQNIKTEVYMAV